MEETREALFQQAHELGIEPKEAFEILKRNGVNEKYNPQNHKRYLGILTSHAKMLHQLIGVANHNRDAMITLDPCPVCGATVEHEPELDGLYGGGYGWRCTSPDQGKPSHFFQHRLEPIRLWMQRNQGMSDPETSSEISAETESPSGSGLTESFKQVYSEPLSESIGLTMTEVSVPDTLT